MRRLGFTLFLLLLAMPVWATDYHVAKTGSDATTCANADWSTTARAKLTIASGLACLTAGGQSGQGHRLLIHAGTYAERINSNTQLLPRGTSYANAPVIGRYQTDVVIMNGSGGDIIGTGTSTVNTTIGHIIFDGLIADGINQTNQSHNVMGSSGTPSNVRIINMELRNGRAAGIFLPAGSSNFQIINNWIHHNGQVCTTSPCAHGIYVKGTGHLVDGNRIEDNHQFGLQVFADGGGSHNHVVKNNRIARNNRATNVSGGGLWIGSGNDNVAVNNIIYSNGNGVGITIASFNPQRTLLWHNTVYGNGGDGIAVGSSSTPLNTEVKNNIVYNNGAQIVHYAGTGTTYAANLCGSAGTGCGVTGNPGFAAAAGGDFRIAAAGSPALNAATTLGRHAATTLGRHAATDAQGRIRPVGQETIGALQVASTAPPEPIGNVAKYIFEGLATDSSGQGHHGTLIGNATFGAGAIGSQALSLDGTGDYVQVTGTTALRPTAAVCVSAWVLPTNVGHSGTLLSMGASYEVLHLTDGSLEAWFYNGTSFLIVRAPGANVLAGGWHHVVYTYNGTTQRLYVDAVEVGALASTGTISYTLGTDLLIGRESGSTTRDYAGFLDQVYVFDGPCSATAVNNLFAELDLQ